MNQSDDGTPQRRPRQQLSCVQCRRRKVKCDHERPCKRCRIRGWDRQCSYPIDIPPGPGDTNSVVSSPRRASAARSFAASSPSLVNRPRPSNSLSGPASTYGSPSAPAALATPESFSGGLETLYGFPPARPSGPAPPQRTTSEPEALATPISASPQALARPQSVAPTLSTEKDHDQNGPGNSQASAVEPRTAPEYALYLTNEESIYFGRSSCPWLISKFSHIMGYIHENSPIKTSERLSYIRIKRLTSLNLMLQDQEEIPPSGLACEVPSREVSDLLVGNYFKTFERMYPLFEPCRFWSEYESFWQAPNQARLVFVVILLLVICTGNSTLPNEERPIPRSKITRWWRLGLAWQSAAAETNERMMSTLQAGCLIVNLRQVYSLSETAEWVSSGSLVKVALAMGLHRDPSKLKGIPQEDHELRRRIFFTIIEIDLQFCLNAGMLPTIRIGDWDTFLPDLSDDPPDRCPHETNQSHGDRSQAPVSIQARMLSSLNTRMKIACSANAIIPEGNYDKVLNLTNQLSESFHGLDAESPSCRKEILKFLYNRYMLTLHVPFAIAGDPKFAFSQNVCLTSALSILEQMAPPPAESSSSNNNNAAAVNPSQPPPPYDLLADLVCINSMRTSGILFKNAGFYAALYLCHELIRDAGSDANPSSPNLVRALPSIKARVINLIECFVKIAEERLRTTQFAGKAFLIPRMVLAYHRISEDCEVRTGEEKERRLLEAGRVIGEICMSIFCSNPEVARVL
ncbi:hypothetical protein B0J12DRAFT_450083 [Macrophomina phaseolina]|uniref:Zn(2)-C6 fungal-type domain-containing protein n=1 Tax=Macrophomina phaseolina TaxID=35725 RepID=A0ABQ8GF94_9PEZI|nr:hypothetical protein B0J12DRAFT_450083 [Macrophomina phaseolina]